MNNRYIGIQHRVKETVEGEARPTIIALVVPQAEAVEILEMETELDELDFVLGQFPTSWRSIDYARDSLSDFPEHHVKWRKLKSTEDPTKFPPAFLRDDQKKGGQLLATKVPKTYDGLAAGDVVSAMFGGSGDMLILAMAHRAEDLGAQVFRIPPHVVSGLRPAEDKSQDAELLARLVQDRPDLFHLFRSHDADLILVRELLRLRIDTMKARIACEQRLRQRMIGAMFRNLTPEGDLTKAFEARKANDQIFQAVLSEEARANRELEAAVKKTSVFSQILESIDGVGPSIAGRIIAAVTDIRRFATKARLKSFCGVGVQPDGSFTRRRSGQVANWHPEARQALYLLADQFNRRPGSEWGQILLYYKQKLRQSHPEMSVPKGLSSLHRQAERVFAKHKCTVKASDFAIDTQDGLYSYIRATLSELEGREVSDEVLAKVSQDCEALLGGQPKKLDTVTLYSAGHIHKMAMWRSVTKFTEWLFREWWRLENKPEGFVSLPPNVLKFAAPDLYQSWREQAIRKDPGLAKILDDAADEATSFLDEAA